MKYKQLICATVLLATVAPQAMAGDTAAVLRLRDERKKHPQVVSVSFPGNTTWREAYDAIYSHGAIVENPWAAFRVYMNESQAVDLYLKPEPCMEAAAGGFYATPEHIAAGGGRDVLRVGKSVGLGSFRGYRDGRVVSIDSVQERGQRVLGDSAVQVTDIGWRYGDHSVDMSQIYTVRPDSPDLFVEIKLNGHTDGDVFCTGVQKLDTPTAGAVSAEGRAWSEGSNVPDGKHPEFVENIRLEIEVDPVNVAGIAEDDLNYLILLKPDAGGIIRYRVRAGFL